MVQLLREECLKQLAAARALVSKLGISTGSLVALSKASSITSDTQLASQLFDS